MPRVKSQGVFLLRLFSFKTSPALINALTCVALSQHRLTVGWCLQGEEQAFTHGIQCNVFRRSEFTKPHIIALCCVL